MTSSGQLVLPPGQQVLDADLRLAVPGGRAATDRAAYEASGPTAAVICAERVECSLQTSAGMRRSPILRAVRTARVGDDPVPDLDCLGGCGHPSHRRRRVQMVSQERRVGAFPTSAGVSHQHGIRDQDMIVHLGIAGRVVAWREVAQVRPPVATRVWARPLRPPLSATRRSRYSRVASRSASTISCMSSARPITPSSALICEGDDELQTRTQTADETPTGARVMRTTDAEEGR